MINLFSYQITHYLEVKFFNTQLAQVTKGLTSEESYVNGQIQEIATSPGLMLLIKTRDAQSIGIELAQKQEARGLNVLNVTDATGVVLARTQTPSRNGDYLFQTTSYGRKIAEGETSVVSIEQGSILPLLVVAGAPVRDAGVMIGAVFGGYSIDDTFAHDFKTKYLNDGKKLIFYSTQKGVIASNFDDPNTKNLLTEYFSTGSDWIQKSQTDREIIIEGKTYLIKNIVFPGLDKSPGGVLVLFPIYYPTEAFLFALFFGIFFVVITFYFHTRLLSKNRRLFELSVIGICFAIILGGGFLIDRAFLFTHSLVVSLPSQGIYNSTMSLNPASGIWDRSFSQIVSVNVETGGEMINAADISLTYDPARLRIDSIDTTESVCSPNMFLEKTIDNKQGNVHVQCLMSAPGFSLKNGTIFKLIVQPLKIGDATLHFANTNQVLASDGLGTNVLRLSTDASYRIIDSTVAYTNGIPSVIVFSPTHSNSAYWYNRSNPLLTWVSSAGYQYRYSLDQSSTTATLSGASSTTTDSVAYTKLPDGIYYFHIVAEKNDVFGAISDYKLMIDATPPLQPFVKISQTTAPKGQIVRIEFTNQNNTDLDYINEFYIKFDDGMFLPTTSPLSISLPVGHHTITVRGFDNSGNFADTSTNIQVTNN